MYQCHIAPTVLWFLYNSFSYGSLGFLFCFLHELCVCVCFLRTLEYEILKLSMIISSSLDRGGAADQVWWWKWQRIVQQIECESREMSEPLPQSFRPVGSEEDEDKGYRGPVLSPTSQTVTDPAGSARLGHTASAAYTQARASFRPVGRSVSARVGTCTLLMGSATGEYSIVGGPPSLDSWKVKLPVRLPS